MRHRWAFAQLNAAIEVSLSTSPCPISTKDMASATVVGLLMCVAALTADAAQVGSRFLRAQVDDDCKLNVTGTTQQDRCNALSNHIDQGNRLVLAKLSAVPGTPAYPSPEYEENYHKLDTCPEIIAELKELKKSRDHCSEPRRYCWKSVRVNMDTWIQNVELLKEHFKC